MIANRMRPGRGGGLDGDDPGGDRVVCLSSRRAPLAPTGPSARRQGDAAASIHWLSLQFTSDDRATLAAWARDVSHGYDRLHVEQGVLEDGTWTNYALVYVPGQSWSTWGLMRRDDHVQVWRCATGQTMGRHMRMADALASLPHAADHHRALPSDAGDVGTRLGSRRHKAC